MSTLDAIAEIGRRALTNYTALHHFRRSPLPDSEGGQSHAVTWVDYHGYSLPTVSSYLGA